MSEVQEAAKRIAAAAQARSDRDAAGQAEVARIAQGRAALEAQRVRAREDAIAEHETLLAAGRQAYAVATDALGRIGRAEAAAHTLLGDHARQHASRRDVAEGALDGVLARVEPALRLRSTRFAAQLVDPVQSPSVEDALTLVALTGVRDRPADTAGVLRGLLDDFEFSPLSSGQYDAVRVAARAHVDAIRAAVAAARAAAGEVGEVVKALDRGGAADATVADPTVAAARVLAADDRAQAELHLLQQALYPTPTTEETSQ